MLRHVAVLAAAALVATAAPAAPIRVELAPDAAGVSFELAATMHTVHGSFALVGGAVTVDPSTGAADGEIVVDARSGDTGNDRRDRKMHSDVLSSAAHQTFMLRPERITGGVPAAGVAALVVTGSLEVQGRSHEVEIPVTVTIDDGSVTVHAEFEVPYVEWGLRDPSKLLLWVGKTVAVTVDARGLITAAAPADPASRPQGEGAVD